ncbi:MAG: VTT domain-containing protein [Actinomycetota bacterium]
MNIAANIFDAHSVVADLGLIGVLAIIFAETGLLIGLAFPGDSLLFVAGVAASGSGAAILGGAHLQAIPLFTGAPLAAIIGAQVGHMLGALFGRKLFDRPDGRIFNQQRVASTEKWLLKYGVGRALVLSRFIPVIRTLINPMAGITHISAKRFFLWNALGAVIWTELVLGIGYVVGEKLKGSVDKYLLPVVALIVVISFIPVVIEFFREWSTRKHHS